MCYYIARQFYFESFYQFQLAALAESSEPRIAEIAVRVAKEIQYHLRHTRQWLVRLGDGTDESHARMQRSIDDLWRFTGEMFAADGVDAWAAEHEIGPDPSTLLDDHTKSEEHDQGPHQKSGKGAQADR